MAELFRYAAFISYSSKDAKFAQRLHRALESYGIPSSLGNFDLIGGGKQNRIYPVFRDREELSAGHLGDQIEANLKASATLIVVCSPNGAASPWVQKEIEYFAALGRHAKIFAIIPDTAALVDDTGADSTQSCFPPAFRGDALSGDKLEPLAADARKGKDGFRNAWLKIVAGMIGVSPGQIIDRDRARRRLQRAQIAASAVGLLSVAIYAAAFVDAMRWRTALITYANGAVGRSETIEPTALAIAGAGREDYLLPVAGSGADDLLSLTGSMNIIRSIGGVDANWVQMSVDGSKLVTRGRDGIWMLYDFSEGEARNLGRARRVTLARNGAVAVIQESDGSGTIRDLIHGAPPRAIGDLGVEMTYRSDLADDGTIFVTQRDSGNAQVFNLATSDAPIDLGRIDTFRLSENGRTLVIRNLDDTLVVLDPRGSRSRRDVGAAHRFVLSENGEVLVVEKADGTGLLFDLVTGAMPDSLGVIGPLRNEEDTLRDEDFQLSVNGRVLVVQGKESGVADDPVYGDVTVYYLAERAAPWNLGPMRTFALSSTGVAIVATDESFHRRVYDVQHRAVARDFGGATRLQTAPRGSALVAIGADRSAQLYDLSDLSAHRNLGQTTGVLFSGDGRALLVFRPDNSVYVYNTANNAPPSPVTDSARRYRELILSGNGEVLLSILEGEELGVVYGISRRSISEERTGGRSQVRAVCRANSDVLLPFSANVRATISSRADDGVEKVLVGRLWNPCDWRGLLAVFPNAERGDGWFEGVRQWLRLMHIRHFGGADYACAEATSAASAETRARRRDMCERFAAPAPT